MPLQGFPKSEKMTLRSDIDRIMSSSLSVYGKGLTLKYLVVPSYGPQFKVLIIAPKRRFRLAVKRNRIKRQIREIFRMNKVSLTTQIPAEHSLHLAIIYSGNEKMDYERTSELYKSLILKIKAKALNKN